MMKLTVTGRHLTVSPRTQADIRRKLQRLERLMQDRAVSAQCVISQQRQDYVCELTLHARGDHVLHGVGRDARLTAAVAGAVQKVTQQAQKVVDKWKTRRKSARAARSAAGEPARREPDALAPEQAAPAAPRQPRVIRARARTLKPMTLDDAMLALSEADQPFLVFRQASSETVAILFRRPDGNIGLIEPEA